MQQLQRNLNTWGVGRRIADRLAGLGIHTVEQLRQSEPKLMRQHFGVVMERTVSELKRISCLQLEEISPRRKQIVSSRSFGQMVASLQELREAVSTYVTRAAEKLRVDRSLCCAVHVFIETNRFRQQDKQYNNGIVIPLTEASSDTRRLTAAALFGLKRIYRPGYLYKKAGVMLMELQPDTMRQASLFRERDDRSDRLMQVMDRLNNEYGRNTLYIASSGIQQRWATQFEMRTPRYTTCWDELPLVR